MTTAPRGRQPRGREDPLPRIVTYNVRNCRGRDRRILPERIAEVIAGCEPDVVALQELDVGRARTGHVDQAEAIARALGMQMHFHPAMTVMEERYGDAILTMLPSRLERAAALPGPAGAETRGALWASLSLGDTDLQVINTHLGLRGRERLPQVAALLGPDWLGAALRRGPTLLAGDFNALPRSRAYRRLLGPLREARSFPQVGRPPPTFPAWWPLIRIDHVFAGPGVRITRADTIASPLARIASDHLPLVVDFEMEASP